MSWYVIYTKRGQEDRALVNLKRQGVTSYLPMIRVQKLQRGESLPVQEPLFPRYLFIQLEPESRGWSALQFTRGVTRLVSFGSEPALMSDELIGQLRAKEEAMNAQPLFAAGEAVRVTSGPFTGIGGVYLEADGEKRAMILVEMLAKSVRLPVFLTQIKPPSR